MRANVMKLWVAMAAVAVVSGCSCDGGKTTCDDLFVSFDGPKDGMAGVSATTDVTIKVVDGAGAAVNLDSAQLVTRASAATEFSVPRDGTLTSGKAVFAAVTLEPGSNVLKVTVKKKGTACTGTKSITVDVPVTNDPPKVISVAFPQDTQMPTGTLNSLELPTAAQLRVDVVTQGALNGTVELINTATNMPLGPPTPIINSTVTVQVPAAALADGPYTLFAKLTKAAQSNTQTGNPEAVKTITLNRTAPTCMVTAPTKSAVGPTEDADSVKAGFQLRVVGGTNAKATTLELKISGGAMPAATGPIAPVSLALARDFDVVSTGAIAYTITVEAKDAVGNVCVATKVVTVDFEPPTLAIISPDGGTETSFNVPLIAAVTDGQDGTVEWKVTDSTGTRDLGIVAVDGGFASSIGSFFNGPQTIKATPTDAFGNVGATVTRPFTVASTNGCAIVFTRPSMRPGFLTVASVSNGNYSFQAASTCANGTAAILRRDGMIISTQTVNNGTVSWTVPVTSGQFDFRAEVGTVFDMVRVTIDLAAPAITQPIDGATLNIMSDVAPGSTGIQSGLGYIASLPTGGRADICSNQVPAQVGTSACADGAAGWWTLKTNVMNPDPTFSYPDGTYCLKLVIVGGATTNVSQPVCLLVDNVAPTISGVTLLRDVNNDKKLNLAELNGMPPEFQFNLGGGHTKSNIARVEVIEGTTVFNSVGAVTFSGAAMDVVNVKLDLGITPSTQTYNWIIEVEDTAGNVTSSTVQVVKIDKVPPTCTITIPSVAAMGRPDDALPGTAPFDLKVTVNAANDTENVIVGTTGAQTLTQIIAPSGGTATHTFALTQTSGVLNYGVTARCIDDSGNPADAAAFAITVDLDAPTCAMTTPVASPPAYSTFSIPTSVTVGGPGTVGRTVQVFSQIGTATPVQVGSLTVAAGGIASGAVTYLNGLQTVTTRVTDPVGNVCTTTGRDIEIIAAGCAISFVSPAIGPSGNAYFTSTSISVTGNTSNCGAGKVVQLFKSGTATAIGSGTTDASGNVIIAATLAEGGPYTLTLSINNGSGLTTTTDLTPVVVDVTPPTAGTVEFNATVYPSTGTSLAFVAATNVNRLPPTPNPTYVVDNFAGGNAEFNVTINGVTGAAGGRVRFVYGGNQVASVNVTSSPQTVSFTNLSLPHNTAAQVLIEAIDAAGLATTVLNVPAVVDVIEPAAPTVTRTVVDNRAATVRLVWAATFDDGTSAISGANTGYEIRWSTSTVTNNNLLALESDYLDSARAHPEANEGWVAGTITRNINVPPNNTYYIVVRAKDEVGNYSPYSAPTPVDNLGTTNTLANPSGVSDSFGATMSAGPLNGIAADELVVAGSGSAKVYVYLGGPGFTTQAGCTAPACQTIDIPAVRTPATETFGNSVYVGKVVDGDAGSQLLVGSANFNSTQGRAFLFFGGANADGGTFLDTTQYVEFRGDGGQFGRHVAVVKDIDGDGIDEVSVTARAYNANRGRLYIFKGRSKAAWQAAAAVSGAILEAVADWIIEGPTPVIGSNNNFAPQLSLSSVGPLTGGPGNDLTVAAAHENVNSVYLFSSSTLGAGGVFTTGTAVAAQQYQTLSRPPTAGPVFTGFGGAVVGNIDVTGAVAKDLVIANPRANSLFVYGDGTPSTFGSPVLQIVGENGMGTTLVTSDINGDGRADLITGEAAPEPNSNRVWVFYNRNMSYDSALGGFYQSLFVGSSTTLGFFGTALTRGDFDGDSKPDIAISDSAVAPGRVVIWR